MPSWSVFSIGCASRTYRRPPGRSSAGDHPGPARDVGEPVERADSRVDEVEVGAEHVRAPRRAPTRRTRASTPRRRGEVARDRERARREVDAGDATAEPGERDGVGADVALEVHDVETGEVAEPRPVVRDDRAQSCRDRRRGRRGRSRATPRAREPATPSCGGSRRDTRSRSLDESSKLAWRRSHREVVRGCRADVHGPPRRRRRHAGRARRRARAGPRGAGQARRELPQLLVRPRRAVRVLLRRRAEPRGGRGRAPRGARPDRDARSSRSRATPS